MLSKKPMPSPKKEPSVGRFFRAQSSQKIISAAKDLLHQTDHEELEENPNQYTNEDLMKIEKERRSLLRRVKRFSVVNILTSLGGTVLPSIFRSPFSWFILAFYTIVRVLMRQVPLGSTNLPVIPLALISIIGGFMSFSLVFFVSQAYSRLCAQYDQSMRIEGRIFNLAYLARSNLLYAEAHRLLRYLNATHVLGYTGLSLVYTDDNLFDIMNDKHQLLTFEELGRIREVGADGGGAAYREVIGWCVELLFDLNKAKPDKNETVAENPIEPLTLQTLVSEVLALRGCIGALYDYDDQPIPFVYVHILFFLTLFYLPLMTYAVALQFPIGSEFYVPDIIGSLLVFVNVVFVVGLREIGRNLISPYGDDSHDLSVIHYITFTMMASRRILAGKKFGSQGKLTEERLELARCSMGAAFPTVTSSSSLSSCLATNFTTIDVSVTTGAAADESKE